MHHVLSYDGLHLQRIEELLVVEHVAHGLLVVLNLAELDQKNVCQLLEVFRHVVDGDSLTNLVFQSLHFPVHLRVDHAKLFIVIFEGLRVLLHPKAAVSDLLLHSLLKFIVVHLLFLYLTFHISDMLSHLTLRMKHD